MRISRLRLRAVKRHADLTLALAPGLTIIRGPNEAGKSTIQRALEMALFRRVTSTAQETDGVRSWGAGETDPTIELEFEEDGTPGRLKKVFAGSRGQVELTLGPDTLVDPVAVDQRLAELTGMPSEKFFRSTASIRHQEMADLDRDEATLRDRLQRSMSGADRGTSLARRKLEDRIRQYRSEGVKNPGELKRARQEVARLEHDVSRGEAALAGLAAARQALSDAREARDALDHKLGAEQAALATASRASELARELGAEEARYARLRRISELEGELARLEAAHPSATPLAELQSGVETLRAQEVTISELRAELAAAAEPSAHAVPVRDPGWRPGAALAIVLAVTSVVLVILVGGQPLWLGVAVIVAVAAALVLLLAFRVRRRALGARLENELLQREIAHRRRVRSDLAERLESVERARGDSLRRLGVVDLAAGERLLTRESAHVNAIERVHAELRGVLGPKDGSADHAPLRDAAAARVEQLRHALAGMGEVGHDPDATRARQETIVRATQGLRERALREEASALTRVELNSADAEQVASLAEALETARAELAAVERRLRIYETTLGALDAAEVATMKRAARFLEQRMGPDMELITDGRYSQIQVDENELSFRVWSPEREDWVDVRSLSQGALDQFYLAARLGLVRQVIGDRRPPLVLDDPFVTFDDVRARRALDLVRALARDLQIIYLTTTDRYDEAADLVVELPAPTLARESALAVDGATESDLEL